MALNVSDEDLDIGHLIGDILQDSGVGSGGFDDSDDRGATQDSRRVVMVNGVEPAGIAAHAGQQHQHHGGQMQADNTVASVNIDDNFVEMTKDLRLNARSAPPTMNIAQQEANKETHDVRYDPNYYAYYYSQRPLDPRLPPPLYSPWGGADDQPTAEQWQEEDKGRPRPKQDEAPSSSILGQKQGNTGDSDVEPQFANTVWSGAGQTDRERKPLEEYGYPVAYDAWARARDTQPPVPPQGRGAGSGFYGQPPQQAPQQAQQYNNSNLTFFNGNGANAAPSRGGGQAAGQSGFNAAFNAFSQYYAQQQQIAQQQQSAATTAPAATNAQSSLLHEYKATKQTHTWMLSEIRGHYVEFASDQHGSRFIQQKIEVADKAEKEMVFAEIEPHAVKLMQDVCGNYVIQKVFEHGLPEQISGLGERLRGMVLTLSLQMYGCRVVQKALENVDADMRAELVTELDQHLLACVKDQNGNHVIQKCIEVCAPKFVQSIVDAITGQVFQLAVHPFGCRVLQKILDVCNPVQVEEVKQEMLRCSLSLVQDQYGNYVVQNVVERGTPADRTALFSKLQGHLCQMACHKFASNVIEKCMIYATQEQIVHIVDEILLPYTKPDGTTDDNIAVHVMARDQYANYVLQKLLDSCSPRQRERLISKLRPQISTLRRYTYGKHIVSRIEQYDGHATGGRGTGRGGRGRGRGRGGMRRGGM